GGPAEIKQAVELNFGIRVHRYIMINFGAFITFVDALGGIDVDVPKAIYDPQFPAEDGSGTVVLPRGLSGKSSRWPTNTLKLLISPSTRSVTRTVSLRLERGSISPSNGRMIWICGGVVSEEQI
ncbi:MAG: hypothetical protein HC872_06735, partial [Gammaproteobacteria bacterium]|nr:hypothetical protein [Gammaproteobacteria bacterium]